MDIDDRLHDAGHRWRESQGPALRAPRLDVSSAKSPSRRWMTALIPLAASLAVAGVTIGATAAVNALLDRNAVAPATPRPVPTAAPRPVPTATPTSPSTPTTPATTLPTQSPVVVELGGASISLPPGWVARDYALYLVASSHPIAAQQWCLTPSQLPTSTKDGACPLTLGTIDMKAGGNAVDVDAEGGWSSNPQYCSDFVSGTSSSETTGDRPFGGRTADWRRWTINCHDGTQHLLEQYVVASGPGLILFSEHADASVHDAMTEITTHSTLPPRTSALRYMDRGYIRSIDRTSAGAQIRLDRAVSTLHGFLNENPATYLYVIPTAMFDQAHLVVGSLGELFTDGTTVTAIHKTS